MRRSKGNYRDLSAVDPPAQANGAMAERALAEPAVGGNGFFNQFTVWDAFSGQADCITDVTAFLDQLDQNPRLRSSANLRSLSRVRTELERMPESSSLGDPVQLKLQDVLVLMTALMSRMR